VFWLKVYNIRRYHRDYKGAKMAKYRKKPVVIDAEEYRLGLEDGFAGPEGNSPYINTLEGRMFIMPDDFIITGIKGEMYPCKPDIFHASYELVEDE
jgi:hypothetical protein